MDTIYSAFIALVGTVPYGYEPVVYIISACFTFYLITVFFGFFVTLFRR